MDTGDAEKFTEWLNDLELTTYLSNYSNMLTLETEKALLEKLSKDHNYSIVDISTNNLIGATGFMELDHINQTGEAGIFIGDKNYWNKGYGTEAFQLLLDYGFKALNLHNVLLRVNSFNERAIKTYEKVGFKLIGKRRDAIKRGNKTHNLLYMDLLYNDFYKRYKP